MENSTRGHWKVDQNESMMVPSKFGVVNVYPQSTTHNKVSGLNQYLYTCSKYMLFQCTGPDSANGRVSASGAGGRGFDPGPRHTKGVKNGTSGYLAWRSAL